MSSAGDGFARGEEVSADPYAFFAHLRREEPLHLDGDGLYRLTWYRDVVAALTDERLSADDAHWQRCDPFAETILDGLDSPAARARRQWFLLRRFEGLAFAGEPPVLPVSRRGLPPAERHLGSLVLVEAPAQVVNG